MYDIKIILDKGEKNELTVDMIDSLEDIILDLNRKMAAGVEGVDDSVYDTLKGYLEMLSPESEVLQTIWSEDGDGEESNYDIYLPQYPMKSIKTIKSLDKLYSFKDRLPFNGVEVLASVKLNGHGIRVVYCNGELVRATTRGRNTAGRNITEHMRIMLGERNDELADYGMVELRGEIVLPFANLELARGYVPKIKSAFSGVSSMIRDSASVDEIRLLHFVAYDIIMPELVFETLEEKFLYMESLGFEIPLYRQYMLQRDGFDGLIFDILADMDEATEGYAYFLDGIVVAVNNVEAFAHFGEGTSERGGNFALKMGKWRQDGYSGVIERIDWNFGKTKITPVAVLEGEGVLTTSGNYVKNVPLFNPRFILELDAYPNNVIFFKYGGESGVYPCFPDGTAIELTGLE